MSENGSHWAIELSESHLTNLSAGRANIKVSKSEVQSSSSQDWVRIVNSLVWILGYILVMYFNPNFLGSTYFGLFVCYLFVFRLRTSEIKTQEQQRKQNFATLNAVVTGLMFFIVLMMRFAAHTSSKSENQLPAYLSTRTLVVTGLFFMTGLVMKMSIRFESDAPSIQYQSQSIQSLHFVILGVLSASCRSVLLLPYQVLFWAESIMGCNLKLLRHVLTWLLILELSTQWVVINFQSRPTLSVIGFFWTSTPAEVSFWLKVCLLVVQFSRREVEVSFDRQESYPGFFCTCGILFALLCPGVQFIPFILLFAFFGCSKQNDAIFSPVMAIFGAYTITKYVYQICMIFKGETNANSQDLAEIFGFYEYHNASSTIFPQQYECLLLLVMAMCQKHFQPNRPSENQSSGQQQESWYSSFSAKISSACSFVVTLLVLHSHSIGLVAALVVLLLGQRLTVISMLLYLTFTVLMLQSNFQEKKRTWYLLAANCTCILAGQYTTRIFRESTKESRTLEIFGLTLSQDVFPSLEDRPNSEISNLALYAQPLILFVVSIAVLKVQNSDRLIALTGEYLTWEELLTPQVQYNRQRLADQDEDQGFVTGISSPDIQNKKIDLISWICGSANIYLLLFTLAFTSVVLPLSAPSLLLLGLMTLIILKSISTKFPNEVYKSTGSWTFKIIGMISTLTVAAQLISAFLVEQSIGLQSEYTQTQKTSSAAWWSLVMGVDEQLFEWRILVLFAMIGYSTIALKMIETPVIARKTEQEQNSQEALFQRRGLVWKVVVYLVYFLWLALPVVLIIAVFTIALYKPSVWGAFSLSTLLFLVWYEQSNFWRTTYYTIGILTQFEAIITYTLEFSLMLINQVDPELSSGSNQTETFLRKNLQLMAEQDVQLFNQLTWLFLILFLCFLQQVLLKFAEDFKNSNTGDMISQLQALKHQNLDIFIFTQGLNLTLIVLLITMLCKRNLSSLFYLPIFTRLITLNFYPTRVNDGTLASEDYLAKQQRVKKWMGYLMFLTQFFIIAEYMITYFLWQEDSKLIPDKSSSQYKFKQSWITFVEENLCYLQSELGGNKQCISDWSDYVGLGNKSVKTRFFFWQIVLLLTAYVSRAFTCGEVQLQDHQLVSEPVLGDESDFTIQNQGFLLEKFIYNYFPYYLISSTLICISSLNPGNNSTIITCYYLVLILSIGVQFRRLLTRNLKVMWHLRTFNLTVLIGQLIFQIPAIPCPYDVDGQLYYKSTSNCPVTTLRDESTNLYVLFMHTLGLYKLQNTSISFVVLYVVCELQAWAFAQPQFKVYVLGRHRITKYDAKMRAFMFVQNYHLHTRWAFEAISEQIKLLHLKLQRTVEICASVLPRDLPQHEEQNLISETSEVHINSENRELCEQMCAEQLTGLVPPVSISQLKLTENQQVECSKEEAIIFYKKRIVQQQGQILQAHREDLYNTEGVGLEFALDSVQKLPNEFEFYFEAIVKKPQERVEKFQSSGSQSANEVMPEFQQQQQNNSTSEIDIPLEQLDVLTTKPESSSFWQGVDSRARALLLRKSNKLVFKSLFDPQSFSVKQVQQPGYFALISGAMAGQIEKLCLLVMCVCYTANSNLITLTFPCLCLLYGLLSIKPSRNFWNFVTWYTLTEIMLKIIVQLPIFCSTPAWSMWQCSDEEIPPEILIQRYDFVIGLQKFYGPSSFPRDQGILRGLIWDLILMVMLINLRRFLWKVGRWQYVENSNQIRSTPRFNSQKQRVNQSQTTVQLLGNLFNYIKSRIMILLPQLMSSAQPNSDMRSSPEHPLAEFDARRFKPGSDFFNGTFYTLLAIFFYTLLFYKNIVGMSGQDLADGTEIDLNHFTIWQVLLLFVLMCLMLTERMLYRVKQDGGVPKYASTARFTIYLVEVITVHTVFSLAWPYRGIRLSQNGYVKVYYCLWLAHFTFSALQIRYGYPIAPYKQTFLRDTSPMIIWLYRIYRAIPFLWEMKVITDWTVTTTCLDLFQWFRFDDAAQYVFYNKYCSDDRALRPEFQSRGVQEKITQGFCFAFGLILLVLAPILLFSGFNPGMVENQVQSGQLQIKFTLDGIDYPFFIGHASQLFSLTETDVSAFEASYKVVNAADTTQMQQIDFLSYSEQNWQISDPMLEQLIKNYNKSIKSEYVNFESSWSFQRQAPVGAEQTSGRQSSVLTSFQLQKIFELLENSISTERSNITTASIIVPNIFPNMLRLDSSKVTQNLEVITSSGDSPPYYSFANLTLHLGSSGNLYWTFQPLDPPATSLQILLYNESVVTSIFYDTGAFSVIGLYVTLVYAVGSFLRIMFDRYSERVIYEELPDTERLREICEGICIAQQEGDLRTEKYLYDLLIAIYRNPQLMIKMTGMKNKYLSEQQPSQNKLELVEEVQI